MSDITQITGWRIPTTTSALYERLLGALGTEEFGPAVRDSVVAVTGGARRIYLFEAKGPVDTSLQYYFGERGLEDLFPVYLKSYRRLDPVSDAYRAAPKVSDVALQRVRPSQIASAGFRRSIFDDAGIVERVSVIQRGPESWRVINVARDATHGRLSDGEITSLVGLACLVLPMLPLNRERGRHRLPLTVTQVEERFATRYPALTVRERQVCARAVIGRSVEATAMELGIRRTSVLTYRRRAYQRLEVNRAHELCALVTH